MLRRLRRASSQLDAKDCSDTLSSIYFFPYRVFLPKSKGMYLYLIMCLSNVSKRSRASSRCHFRLTGSVDASSNRTG